MAKHQVETELKLTGEGKLHEGLEHIGEGFEHLEDKVHEAGHEIGEMLKSAAGVALGFQLEGAVESFREIGHEAFEAAAGVEEQEKAIRGVLAMIDEEGASMDDLGKEAHELNEAFSDMSEATGAAKADVVAAFDEMAERTGLATKDVSRLTEMMAEAGKGVKGGIGALSEGFSNLSSGIIRARNPIVQMIAATGMLHGTAKSVAAQMMKMSPDKAMQLGIDAVEKMGNKMKGLPLTFNQLVSSLKTVREEIFESLGAPILKALGGPLDRLRQYFMDHAEMVQHWASVVGDKVGEWIGEAADEIQEGFEYLQDHAEEIKAAFKQGAEDVKAVVDFILAHKTQIAEAFAAKTLMGAAGSVSSGLGLVGKAGAVEKAGVEAGEVATAAKEAANLDALRESLMAKAEMGEIKWSEALGEVEAAEAEAAAGAAETAEATAAATVEFVTMAAVAAALAAVAAAAYGAFEDLTDGTSEYHDAAVAAWADIKQNLLEAWDELTVGSDSLGSDLKELAEWMGKELLVIVADVTWGLKELAKVLTVVGHIIEGLVANSPADQFRREHGEANAPRGIALDRGGDIRGVTVESDKESGAIKAPPVYNFTGDIHIQQDFKDNDPDRILTVFKEGVGRAAQSKVSSSMQVPQSHF